MTWAQHHDESEQLAARAELAARDGNADAAKELYRQAAEAEVRALSALDARKARTLGVTAVSAVALWYKAERFAPAERLAHHWLSSVALPEFASRQLQTLLQSIWSEQIRQKAGLRFSRGEVLVAVRGGEIVAGGAPLDLVVSKVEAVQALFFRTAEFLKGLPHRKRGPASNEIQQICRPWLFQSVPGSYQFAVAIEEPKQSVMFIESIPSQEISRTFLRILRASVNDPEAGLTQVVPDKEYRDSFLRLTRGLAPTGKSFSELEITSPDDLRPITLLPSARQAISDVIGQNLPERTRPGDREESLHGVLRALHLDKDWLEVTVDERPIIIRGVGESVDDVVGPMVNKRVVVDVLRSARNRYTFRDIQLSE